MLSTRLPAGLFAICFLAAPIARSRFKATISLAKPAPTGATPTKRIDSRDRSHTLPTLAAASPLPEV